MKKLKNEEILQMVEKVKNVLVGHSKMNNTVQRELRKLGFRFIELGCGYKSKICSQEIRIKMPLKMWRDGLICQGKYLCVGFSNIARGRNYLYRAFAVEIEPTSYENKFINSTLTPRILKKFPKFQDNVAEYIENLKNEGHITSNESKVLTECKNEKAVSEKGEVSITNNAEKILEEDIENETKISSATA